MEGGWLGEGNLGALDRLLLGKKIEALLYALRLRYHLREQSAPHRFWYYASLLPQFFFGNLFMGDSLDHVGTRDKHI